MTRIEVPKSSGRRRSGGLSHWLLIILAIAVIGTGLWTWLTLAWSYAEGERAGVLQKFVRRGWLCKTQEGEVALFYGGGQYLGPSAPLWDFSVRDKSVAQDLSKAVGRRVQLHYTEHPGIPTSCFGETRYFVDKVTLTDERGAILEAPASADAASALPLPLALPSSAPAAAPAAPDSH